MQATKLHSEVIFKHIATYITTHKNNTYK